MQRALKAQQVLPLQGFRRDSGLRSQAGTPCRSINGGLEEIAVEDVNFTCTIFATLDGGSDAEGDTVQTLNVIAMPTLGQCETHEDCRQNSPAAPFCVSNLGCTDGSLGTMCLHDSQCDDTIGLFCASSLLCDDGDAGTSCRGVGDCADGLACDNGQCGMLE